MHISFSFHALLLISNLLIGLSGFGQKTFVVNSDAALRAGPGIKYQQVFVIKAGEKVVQIDSANLKWLKVNYEEHIGFTSRKLLTAIIDTGITASVTLPVIINKPPEPPGFSYPIVLFIIGCVLLLSFLLMPRKKRSKSKPPDNADFVPDWSQAIAVDDLSNSQKEMATNINITPNIPAQTKVVLRESPAPAPSNNSVPSRTESSKIINPKVKEKVPVLLSSDVSQDLSLNNASEAQKTFFHDLKKTFLSGNYLDIEGNQNYVLILLDNLLKDYDTHQNLILLKAQLRQMDLWYPFIKKFTAAALEKKVPIVDSSGEIQDNKHQESVVLLNAGTNIGHDEPQENISPNHLSEELKTKINGVITALQKSSPVTEDKSVIDINNWNFETSISMWAKLPAMPDTVPYWQHIYVYTYNELLKATPAQQTYYAQFKDIFLKSQFPDLQGNSNYAFILLFDFLQEYDQNKNLLLLKSNLTQLGEYYPVTRRYAMNFLAEKIRKSVSPNGSVITGNFQNGVNTGNNNGYYFEASYWGLGTKYKTKLNLKEEYVILLNKIGSVNNTFTDIEWCCKETIKLFLAVVSQLQEYYKSSGSFDKELESLAALIATKHFHYKINGNNFKYSIDPIKNEIFATIYKCCENAVREKFNHKRKLNTEWTYSSKELQETLQTKINAVIVSILPALENNILLPDEEADIKLYTQNTARWKVKFDELTNPYDGNAKKFVENIIALGLLNKNNPSVENIFYEASKFIAKTEKEIAVRLYVYYLHYDLASEKFDNKQFSKTIHKSLFKTEEQLISFGKLITQFIKDKNLDKALTAVSEIYRVKRKKIQLDTSSIKQVEEQYAGTVELLNEYLTDEPDNAEVSLQTAGINSAELTVTIGTKDKIRESPFITELVFTSEQMDLLDLFSRHNLMLPLEEIESFAHAKKIFAKPMIESINETCFEKLDDVLIEDENTDFVINPDYYQIILLK